VNLADFIDDQRESIVEEWAEFARTCIDAARTLSATELRDHAKLILQHVAADMKQPQNEDEKHRKSRGTLPGNAPELTAAARADAEQRLHQGFSLDDVIAEYRALRASVLRRWMGALPTPQADTLQQLVRFNEAIDQAVAEAVSWYTQKVEESRAVTLGILGHDLRNPLGSAGSSAQYLLMSEGLSSSQTRAAARIRASTSRMSEMVNDLLDFTRTQLGGTLPVRPEPTDLDRVCHDVVAELQAFHPDRVLTLRCSGDLKGHWDASRMAQLLSNLASNALQHGEADKPVAVCARGDGNEVSLHVHSHGPGVTPSALPLLFDTAMRPTVREAERREGSSGLGLGLYIVREIAKAHGGEVRVESPADDGGGTTFIVQVPRRPPSSSRHAR
jgi:signal transduction histidine kinase